MRFELDLQEERAEEPVRERESRRRGRRPRGRIKWTKEIKMS